MLLFSIGIVIGAALGVAVMALLQSAAGADEEIEKYENNLKDSKNSKGGD